MGTWPPEIKESIDIDMRQIRCFGGEMVTSTQSRGKGGGSGKGSRGQSRRRFTYGMGCKDWLDCFTCPKAACDWQANKNP